LLANHGYAVFHPSVNLVVGRPGESWVKGVTTAANRLIDMGVADPDRLGVHGTSYGGYATVLLLTETDRFKAAINISGKVNMVSFYTDSPRLGVRNTHAPEKSQDRIGGTLWEYPERYLEHSAIMRADRIKTPLLNITGDQDPNVPASQSREIYYALRRLGKTSSGSATSTAATARRTA
jgi:dipeptidyl aminopeptidase/acylaminoacyl peptidase